MHLSNHTTCAVVQLVEGETIIPTAPPAKVIPFTEAKIIRKVEQQRRTRSHVHYRLSKTFRNYDIKLFTDELLTDTTSNIRYELKQNKENIYIRPAISSIFFTDVVWRLAATRSQTQRALAAFGLRCIY